MIDHVTIKVSNLELSKRFYEKTFAPLKYKISFGNDGVFYAFDVGQGCLFEIIQHKSNEKNASEMLTSTHIAFRVPDQEQVRAFYNAALSAGAKDNVAHLVQDLNTQKITMPALFWTRMVIILKQYLLNGKINQTLQNENRCNLD